MNPFLRALSNNNQDAVKMLVKLIAFEVRKKLEDFPAENISEQEMKALHMLVMNGIYNALFSLSNFERIEIAREHIDLLAAQIPSHWEEPKLDPVLQKAFEELKQSGITFKSPFLNGQLKIGNLFWVPAKGCIELRPSVDFVQVDERQRAKHRNKITAALRNEGYTFNDYKQAYTKPV